MEQKMNTKFESPSAYIQRQVGYEYVRIMYWGNANMLQIVSVVNIGFALFVERPRGVISNTGETTETERRALSNAIYP